jgi:hypothetical protein
MDGSVLDARDLPVEVSGWDSSENFFVEKTHLGWGREGNYEIAVHRHVRVGCVVFVRLLRPFADNADFPIAYRVDQSPADTRGEMRISLSRLHPKASFRETFCVAPSENQRVA